MKHSPVNVLIIDADADFCTNLEAVLSQEGHQVKNAATAASGLKTMENEVFQMIIVDRSLVEADGCNLVKLVRTDNTGLGLIVCMSSPSVDDVVWLMKQGVDDIVCKPCPATEVLNAVNQVIARRELTISPSDMVNSAIGAHLREMRLARKLTLKNVANRTGLSVSLISQIELAKTSASISTLHKMACALGIKLSTIFERL